MELCRLRRAPAVILSPISATPLRLTGVPWLKPETRCLVPANSFAEYAPEPNPETKKKDVVWFALNDDRPLRYYEPLRHPRAPSLSLTGFRLVVAPATPWGFPCFARFPCVHAAANTPV